MTSETATLLRRQLEDRRARLDRAIAEEGPDADLVRLLRQVDSALGRLGSDEFARCVVCHEHVDEADLKLNPLLEYCLCQLTDAQQRALQHDFELARRIQAGLLPEPNLAAAGWEASYRYDPAGVVSGDYCDLWVSPGDPGSLYFAVGDVSGKGFAASLLMAHLQAAFRSRAGADVPLDALVANVNRQLLDISLPSHYATLAFGRAGADGGVEIVNAGHCPPLLERGGDVTALGPTGFPIGLLSEEHPYEVTRLRLDEGDTLMLYTDGLTEARRADGEEYGQHRVERLLARRTPGRAARQLVRDLRGDLDGFLGEASRSDDLTLLALRRTGAGRLAA